MKKAIFKNMITLIFTALVIILLVPTAQAQNGTDFSGNWKRNDEKSVPGEGISMNSIPATLFIKQDKQQIIVKKTAYTETIPLNGETSAMTTPSGNNRCNTAKWSADKKTLIIISTTKDEKGTQQQSGKYTYSLENGGKTLKVTAAMTVSGRGDFEMLEIYDKQ